MFASLVSGAYSQKIKEMRYQGSVESQVVENKFTFRMIDKRTSTYVDLDEVSLYDSDGKALNVDLIRGASSQAIVMLNRDEKPVRAFIRVDDRNTFDIELRQNENNLHMYFIIAKLKS